MPSYNFATKASPKVQEAFYKESITEGIFSKDYDWTGVATVRIYSVDDLPMQDYDWDKTDGSRFGTLTELGDTVQELTVNRDRSFNGSIDKRNNTSELMIKAAGKVLARQTRNVIVPEVDKYRLAALAAGNGVTGFGGAGGGTIVYNVSLTKSGIIEHIMTQNAVMNNKLVPKKNRVLYIKESEFIKCKLADQIVGTGATLQDVAKGIIVNGEFGTLDGLHIVPAPDSYMPDGVRYSKTAGGLTNKVEIFEDYVLITHQVQNGVTVETHTSRIGWDSMRAPVLNVMQDENNNIPISWDVTNGELVIWQRANSGKVAVPELHVYGTLNVEKDTNIDADVVVTKSLTVAGRTELNGGFTVIKNLYATDYADLKGVSNVEMNMGDTRAVIKCSVSENPTLPSDAPVGRRVIVVNDTSSTQTVTMGAYTKTINAYEAAEFIRATSDTTTGWYPLS